MDNEQYQKLLKLRESQEKLLFELIKEKGFLSEYIYKFGLPKNRINYLLKKWNKQGKITTYKKYGQTRIELGNKPTEWLPASDDIQTPVDLLRESINYISKRYGGNEVGELNIGGRNLFVESDAVRGFINEKGTVVDDYFVDDYFIKNIYKTSDFILVNPGQLYEINQYFHINPIVLACYDSNKRIVSRTVTSGDSIVYYVVESNVSYIRVSAYYKSKIKVVKKDSADVDWTPAPEDVEREFEVEHRNKEWEKMNPPTIEDLENCFEQAKYKGAKFVAVAIKMEGYRGKEIIINPIVNVDEKLNYYKNAYDENLNHRYTNGVRIVGFTYGINMNEIEKHLAK